MMQRSDSPRGDDSHVMEQSRALDISASGAVRCLVGRLPLPRVSLVNNRADVTVAAAKLLARTVPRTR
jgi:hypothetical protein